MRIFVSCLVLLFLLSSANKPAYQSKTMKFVFGNYGFQIEAPTNWTYIKKQGVDSFVGAIVTNDNDTLFFDMGRYSPTLDHPYYRSRKEEEEDEDDYKTKETTKTINGYRAKFVSHWTKKRSDYGVYFDSLWNLDKSSQFQSKMELTIYGLDLSEKTKKQFNEAVNTIKFIKP